ncbi:cobalamin biosynthesis protein [Streptomyces sp. NPDC059256]|uniref:cobalamin biosynthesis protein n=1 Tax=Streptomyces sp. NPDC059256 TaxID=3346794 RepID=UPI00369F78F1
MTGRAGPDARAVVVGVGASRGVPEAEVIGLVATTLRTAGLTPEDVVEVATVAAKADEPGVLALARWLGVPLVQHPADRLALVPVPHPSTAVLGAVGTASVAEAAALAGGGVLLVPKTVSRPEGRAARATCAVVRRVSTTEIADGGAHAQGCKSGLGSVAAMTSVEPCGEPDGRPDGSRQRSADHALAPGRGAAASPIPPG